MLSPAQRSWRVSLLFFMNITTWQIHQLLQVEEQAKVISLKALTTPQQMAPAQFS